MRIKLKSNARPVKLGTSQTRHYNSLVVFPLAGLTGSKAFWVDRGGETLEVELGEYAEIIDDGFDVWGQDPDPAYPEWVEVHGVKWPCKVTDKSIIIYSGTQEQFVQNKRTVGMVTKKLTSRGSLSVDFAFNPVENYTISMSGYHCTPPYIRLDCKGSAKVLEALAHVRKTYIALWEAEESRKRLVEENRANREKALAEIRATRKLEENLVAEAKAGDYKAVQVAAEALYNHLTGS